MWTQVTRKGKGKGRSFASPLDETQGLQKKLMEPEKPFDYASSAHEASTKVFEHQSSGPGLVSRLENRVRFMMD